MDIHIHPRVKRHNTSTILTMLPRETRFEFKQNLSPIIHDDSTENGSMMDDSDSDSISISSVDFHEEDLDSSPTYAGGPDFDFAG